MEKWHKVVNEKTKEVEVGLGTNEAFYKSLGYILGEVDHAYNGRWYLMGYAPERPLDELKEAKRAEINQAREEARKTEGAEFDGDIFDVDETSQSNILAQIKVAELLKSTEATYTYRSKTNTDHLLTVAELQQLGLMIAQKVNEIYARSWKLKALVDEATTPEEVEAITWDMKDEEEEQAPENI